MSTQKIAIFGATGEVGRRVAEEALKRGHSVTAVVRTEKDLQLNHPNLKVVKGDAHKAEEVAKYAKGHDVVIGFHSPIHESPLEHVSAVRAYIEGTKIAGVKNLVTVGHSFEKKQSNNTQEAYNAYKPIAQANKEALKMFRNETDLNWTYACCEAPQKGEKQGEYLMSEDIVFTQPYGASKVQSGNFSKALVDEAEESEYEHLAHQEDEEL